MRVREKLADLMQHLRILEFDIDIRNWVRFFIENGHKSFTLSYWKQFAGDVIKFRVYFQKDEKLDRYRVERYEATLKKELVITEQVIVGINTKELAGRMEKVDWNTDHGALEELGFGVESDKSRIQAALLPGIMSDLQKLGDALPMGEKLQAAFMYKYWYDTPFQVKTPQTEALKASQEFSTTITPIFNITASETYILLNARALNNLNTTAMNNENLKFLAEKIQYAGFGEDLKPALEKAMMEGKPEFQLRFSTEFNQKPFEATLNFRKSDSSDMYFFNSYHASMERTNGEKMEQTFYLNKGRGVTAKEAFNLMDGRAVQKDLVTKEGQPYKAWLQLNPDVKDKNSNSEVKQFHERYGYDLAASVAKFPVAELKDPEAAKKLMASLQKGNVQSVTLEKDGSSHKMFVEADPKYKSVKLYDAQMKLMTKEALSSYQSVGKETASKTVKEEVGHDKKKEVSASVKQEKQKEGKKESLLPKKRESKKNGLGIA